MTTAPSWGMVFSPPQAMAPTRWNTAGGLGHLDKVIRQGVQGDLEAAGEVTSTQEIAAQSRDFPRNAKGQQRKAGDHASQSRQKTSSRCQCAVPV